MSGGSSTHTPSPLPPHALMQPGSTIMVCEDDPAARAAEAAAERKAAQADHESRMASQLREGELIRAAARQ